MIFVVSDTSGEMASHGARAAAEQFSDIEVAQRRFPLVRTEAEIQRIMEEAAQRNALVVYTIVDPDLSMCAHRMADALGVHSLDLMQSMLSSFS
jgi:regulator of PEP synthase PpsR (kinase-PPPase family)